MIKLFGSRNKKAEATSPAPQVSHAMGSERIDEVQAVMASVGCSEEAAQKRVLAARECGVDFDHYLSNGLFKLKAAALKNYASKEVPRCFAEELAVAYGVSAFDVYTQMKRAKDEFGLTYTYFSMHGLVNVSDQELAEHQRLRNEKSSENIERAAAITGRSFEEEKTNAERVRGQFKVTIEDYYRKMLYDMTDEEIAAFVESSKAEKKKKLETAMAATGWSEGQVRAHINRCIREFGIDRGVYHVLECFLLSDEQLSKFAGLSDSKALAKKYNGDKNEYLDRKDLFDQMFSRFLGRDFWVNQNTNFEEFQSFAQGKSAVFCKPVSASHGLGTQKLDLNERDLQEVYEKLMSEGLMVVEEALQQHPAMAEFNPSSINTVRLFTVLDGDAFAAFNAYVRFGVGDIVDNYSAGGLECGVDPQTGIVTTPALRKTGEVFDKHPVSGKPFEGFQIPHWDQVLARTEEALRGAEGIGYIGWDIAIRENDVVFVEGNAQPGMGVYQRFLIAQNKSIRPSYERFLP